MNRLLVVGVVVLCVACGACQKPDARLNAPPQGTAAEKSPMQAEYTQMIVNALLADMVVTDNHFLAQRATLNSLGQEQLIKLAVLLQDFGGTVRFSTNETDKALVAARTKQILTFLSDQGVKTDSSVLVQDMPGGRGMDATEAILIKVNEGTYHPKSSSSSSSTGGSGYGISSSAAPKQAK